MSEYITRVLLVEDEEVARKTLAFYLNTIFDEVVVACDGSEGFNILNDNFKDENVKIHTVYKKEDSSNNHKFNYIIE